MRKYLKAVRHRDKIVKIKSMKGLKMESIKVKRQRRIDNERISKHHPFYVVALIKEKFGKFSKYRDGGADHSKSYVFYQSKLAILLKSLSSYHSD